MSTDSYIPIYKRSGDGTAKDLLKLKKLEMISDGWYKGQLIKYLQRFLEQLQLMVYYAIKLTLQ